MTRTKNRTEQWQQQQKRFSVVPLFCPVCAVMCSPSKLNRHKRPVCRLHMNHLKPFIFLYYLQAFPQQHADILFRNQAAVRLRRTGRISSNALSGINLAANPTMASGIGMNRRISFVLTLILISAPFYLSINILTVVPVRCRHINKVSFNLFIQAFETASMTASRSTP